MARLAMCGWESGRTDELGTYATASGSESIQTLCRTGTYAYKAQGAGYVETNYSAQRAVTFNSQPSELWVRIAVLGQILNGPPESFLEFLDGATVQLVFATNNVGILLLYRGTTLIASGGAIPNSGSLVCVEAHIVFHGTTGSVTAWINGVQVLTFTGSTISTANARATGFRFGVRKFSGWLGGGDSSAFWLDDLAINDTTGSLNNGRIGQGGIFPLFPTADTADKDWARSAGSDNFSLVNSAPPDDDTTYVTATSVGDRDLYEFGNLTNVNSIDAVAVSGRLRTTVGAGAPVGFAMRSGATTGDVASHQVSGQWTTFTDVVEADPNTAAAWTLAAVNSLQAGFTIL